MSKKTRPKASNRRSRPAPPKHTDRFRAPAGLVAAFAMVNKENSTPIAALHTAGGAYQPALDIIDLLHGRKETEENQDVAFAKVIADATDAEYGETYDDARTMPELTGETGFNLGFAVCWLLTIAVTGTGGVR